MFVCCYFIYEFCVYDMSVFRLSAEEEDKCVNEMRKEGFNFIRIERFK